MLEVQLTQKHILLSILVFFFLTVQVSYLVSGYTDEELQFLEQAVEDAIERPQHLSADKRYARLSYSYGNYGSGRRNTYHNRRYYNRRYYRNYYKPWLNLKDTECFRQRCGSDDDCCRRYNKCDKSANRCYNCWYGHPCKTSRDCCQQFPFCNRQSGSCQ